MADDFELTSEDARPSARRDEGIRLVPPPEMLTLRCHACGVDFEAAPSTFGVDDRAPDGTRLPAVCVVCALARFKAARKAKRGE